MSFAVEFSESQLTELREIAARIGVDPGDLVRAMVADQLAKPRDKFEQIAKAVVEKNQELYRRLG